MARRRSRIPRPVRSAIGSATLVAAVRVVDAAWRRLAGRATPVETRASDDGSDGADGVVRDRLLYALLLGGALRIARRAGLAEADEDTPAEDPDTRRDPA